MPQCHIDGWRMPDQAALEKHLDEIFQENKRLREAKAGASQQWYVNKEDWLREFTDPAERAQTAATFFGMEADKPEDSEEAPVSRVLADEKQEFCPLCGERFSLFFDPEDEEWMYENAMHAQVQEAGSGVPETRIVHTTCHVEGTVPIVGRMRSDSQSMVPSASPAPSPMLRPSVSPLKRGREEEEDAETATKMDAGGEDDNEEAMEGAPASKKIKVEPGVVAEDAAAASVDTSTVTVVAAEEAVAAEEETKPEVVIKKEPGT